VGGPAGDVHRTSIPRGSQEAQATQAVTRQGSRQHSRHGPVRQAVSVIEFLKDTTVVADLSFSVFVRHYICVSPAKFH